MDHVERARRSHVPSSPPAMTQPEEDSPGLKAIKALESYRKKDPSKSGLLSVS